MKNLRLNNRESVTLVMLTMTGATAFNVPGGIPEVTRKRFQEKFGIDVQERDVLSVINKVKSLVTVPGDEEVVIDD